jgi:uncharacterized protein
MSAIGVLLGWTYLLMPLCAMVASARRAWREQSPRVARPLLTTFISAVILGFAINVINAQAADAQMLWGQVLLAAWFIAGVLLALKALDAGLRKALAAYVRRPGARFVLRFLILFAMGLPYLMAIAMVYRPKVHGRDPREQFGREFQFVRFDDSRLSGWWIPAPRGSGEDTVLLCHGLGASKANVLPMAEPMLWAGYNVFVFDFRAHGDSGGQVTSFGDKERHDVLAAVAWLRRERPDKAKRILGLGVSMGAAALIAAAADPSDEGRAISAIAAYGTYDDLGGLARSASDEHFPPPFNLLARYVAFPIMSLHAGTNLHGFVPGNFLERLPPRPILVIHGKSDEIIAFQHGQRLYERALEPKQSLWISGDHNSVLLDGKAARAVEEFFDSSPSRMR